MSLLPNTKYQLSIAAVRKTLKTSHHHQSSSSSSSHHSRQQEDRNSTCSESTEDSEPSSTVSSTTTTTTLTPVEVMGVCSAPVTFVTHDSSSQTAPDAVEATPQLIPKPVKHHVMTSHSTAATTKTSGSSGSEVTISNPISEAEARLSADNRRAVTAMAIFVSSAILLAFLAQCILINN